MSDVPSNAALVSCSAAEMMCDSDISTLPETVRRNLTAVSAAVIRSMSWAQGARIALFGNDADSSAELVVSDTLNKRELRITVYDHPKVDVWMRWASGKWSRAGLEQSVIWTVVKLFQAR